jgi:hypothetical protein
VKEECTKEREKEEYGEKERKRGEVGGWIAGSERRKKNPQSDYPYIHST